MTDYKKRPAVLIVCDGWGEISETYGNAILNAKTPRLNALRAEWPHVTVRASGEDVGLLPGVMGNSEVGHLTIGSGRIKLQPLSRQAKEIQGSTFYENEVLKTAIQTAKERGTGFHVMGLFSDGGVHVYEDSPFALVDMAKRHGLEKIYVHYFADGRDMAPTSAKAYMQKTQKRLQEIGAGEIVSVSGRYYAMDRDKRWDRTELAYNMLTAESFETVPDPVTYIQESYDNDINDEFLQPVSIATSPEDRVKIEDGDVVVFFNFRPDRTRQMSHALCDESFTAFERKCVVKNLNLVTMTKYDNELNAPVAFPEEMLTSTLAEVVSRAGLKQLHIAETEKYAHVTYFMNGGNEVPFEGEDRVLIPSPKVATYDLKPEMSAPEIRDRTVEAIQSNKYDLIIMNFANADMLGHTGMYDKTIEAIDVLDECVADVIDATLSAGGVALMTADHGNAEQEMTPDGNPITAHTINPVPVLVCGVPNATLRSGGGLYDIAPTMLTLLGLDKPSVMIGENLIQ